MKQKKRLSIKFDFKLILFLIATLAFILRVYKVAQVPPGLYWDEAAMALDARSITLTGQDHHGHHWLQPIYPSWGDYKLPGYILLAVPFFRIITDNPALAVRLPSALAGTLTVLVIYFLTQELFRDSKLSRRGASLLRIPIETSGEIGLIASLLLAISPWHLQFSRAAFEANLALFFNLTALLFLLKAKKKKLFLALAIIFSTLGIYTYYSARIVLPLLLIFFFFFFWKKSKVNILLFVFVLASIYFLTTPLKKSSLVPQAEQLRLSTKNILSDESLVKYSSLLIEQDKGSFVSRKIHHRLFYQAKQLTAHFFAHFSFDFLLLSGDANLRHSTTQVGVLLFVAFLGFIYGQYCLFLKDKRIFLFLNLSLLICFLPGCVPYEVPHALRALNGVIFLNIISAYGLLSLLKLMKNKNLLFAVCWLMVAVQLILYLHDYYVHYPSRSYLSWQGGYRQAVGIVDQEQDKADKIIFTDYYHRPYLYYLLYSSPQILKDFQQQRRDYLKNHFLDYSETKQIGKIEFRSIDFDKDKNISNVLLIATPEQVYQGSAVDSMRAFVKWKNY